MRQIKMRSVGVAIMGLMLALCPIAAVAQITPGRPPPTTLSHELFLIFVGALLGGFLGPILQAIDLWLGITPGAKQQQDNYEVQREIASSLRVIADAQKQGSNIVDSN